MDDVLREQIGKCCYVYIDDVIIFSNSEDQHYKDIQKVLSLLYKANMRVSLEKSKFMINKVEYLGFLLQKMA